MGPLWAWVVLWLLSAYGLVLLLRSAMARSVGEPVPVLVATPKPVEPDPPPADPAVEPVESATEPAEPTAEPLEPTAEPLEPTVEPLEPLADPLELTAEPLESLADPVELPAEPLESLADPVDPLADPVDPLADVDLPSRLSTAMPESEDVGSDAPWVVERTAEEASEPWIRGKDLPEAADPWGGGPTEESATVVYRSIELESLTLGLQATDIQDLYGPPGHMSKVGEDGEQWRYPLSATDDRGEGVEGVLLLEFQRGRLVRKALEQPEAER